MRPAARRTARYALIAFAAAGCGGAGDGGGTSRVTAPATAGADTLYRLLVTQGTQDAQHRVPLVLQRPFALVNVFGSVAPTSSITVEARANGRVLYTATRHPQVFPMEPAMSSVAPALTTPDVIHQEVLPAEAIVAGVEVRAWVGTKAPVVQAMQTVSVPRLTVWWLSVRLLSDPGQPVGSILPSQMDGLIEGANALLPVAPFAQARLPDTVAVQIGHPYQNGGDCAMVNDSLVAWRRKRSIPASDIVVGVVAETMSPTGNAICGTVTSARAGNDRVVVLPGYAILNTFSNGDRNHSVFAHELGHNFGRMHAPNAPRDFDPNFPFADSGIGDLGYDVYTLVIGKAGRLYLTPPHPATDQSGNLYGIDVMGYGHPRWMSVYTALGILDVLAERAAR